MAQYVVLYKAKANGDSMLPDTRVVVANCLVESSRSEEDVADEQVQKFGQNFICVARVVGNTTLSAEERNLIEIQRLFTHW